MLLGQVLSDGHAASLLAFKRDLLLALPEAVEAVVLFGSRARGDASPDSDYDVAVLLRGQLAEDRDIERRIADVAWDHQVADFFIQAVALDADALAPPKTELAMRIAAEGIPIA